MAADAAPTPDASVHYEETKRRAVSGGRVMVLRHLTWALISLVGSAILIRSLGPERWASYSVAYFLIVFFDQAFGAPFLGWLIRKPRAPDADDVRAAVFLMYVVGTGAALVFAALSAPAADLYGRDDLTPCLLGVAACAFVYSFRATSVTLLERELRYRTVALGEVVDQLTFYVVAISLVAAGAGIDGVAVALAVRGIPSAVILRRARPLPLRGRSDRRRMGELLRFGIPTTAASLLILVTGLVPVIALGGDDATQLAFFMTAATLVGYAATGQVVAQRVAFPSLAGLSSDRTRFATATWRTIGVTDTLLIGLIVPIAVLSTVWLPLLLGSEWEDAAPALVVIGAGYALNGVVTIGTSALQALGRATTATGLQAAMIAVYVAGALVARQEETAVAIGVAYAASRAVGLAFVVFLLARGPVRGSALAEVGALLAGVAVMVGLARLMEADEVVMAILLTVALVGAWLMFRRRDVEMLLSAAGVGAVPRGSPR